jgi:TPR repeat protein
MAFIFFYSFGLSAGAQSTVRDGQTAEPKVKPDKAKGKPKAQDGGAARYRDGQAREKSGDEPGALAAYLAAAEAGHGRAQMRLAEIYDKGNTAVKRDYAKALHWYEQARAQGLPVPKPHPYTSGR